MIDGLVQLYFADFEEQSDLTTIRVDHLEPTKTLRVLHALENFPSKN